MAAERVSPRRKAGRGSMMTATLEPPRLISKRLALCLEEVEALLLRMARSMVSLVVNSSVAGRERGLESSIVGERRPYWFVGPSSSSFLT